MKRSLSLFVVLALMLGVLSACAPANRVPEGAVTVNELLGSVENTDMNVLKVVELHDEYMVVELNGVRHSIVPDSLYVENKATLVDFDASSGLVYPIFRTLNIFDESNWNLEKEDHPSMEYYVLRDYQLGIPMDSAVNPVDELALWIVIIPIDKMPKVVDYRTWLGTKAEIWVWNVPMRYPWVIQNITTGEIAFFHGSVMDNNGVVEYVVPGMQDEGVLSEGKDSNGSPILIINR